MDLAMPVERICEDGYCWDVYVLSDGNKVCFAVSNKVSGPGSNGLNYGFDYSYYRVGEGEWTRGPRRHKFAELISLCRDLKEFLDNVEYFL